MKKAIFAVAFAAMLAIPLTAAATTTPQGITAQAGHEINSRCQWINGYFRADGTYVQGHWRGC